VRPLTIAAPPATFPVRGRQWHAFHLLGGAGFVAAAALAALLTRVLRLSPGVMAAAAVAGAGVLFLLTYATIVVRSREVIVNYHHLLAVSAVAALAARIGEVPVAVHLAAFVVSLMVFQGFGRLGCFSAGCCHGRPAGWGVRYGERHTAGGFPPPLVGVPLVPTQLIEAVWAFTLAAAGCVLLVRGAAPTALLAGMCAAYAAGRLAVDYLRGDAGRPGFAGLSEAQWTSLLLLCGAAGAAWATRAGLHTALVALAAVGSAGTLGRLLMRWRTSVSDRQLLDADHVLELAGAVAIARGETTVVGGVPPAARVHVATTSRGVSVSAGLAGRTGGSPVRHYTLSRGSQGLSERSARRLAGIIIALRHSGRRGTLVAGRRGGTFHLLVPVTPDARSAQVVEHIPGDVGPFVV
jgi:Prolipoprotein diacylglyceryl transferase